ncbi:MAG TPA: transporter [Candidatus Acidoferrum sp.]|nr:transporter [Candidatus Acidoferrum sp.]
MKTRMQLLVLAVSLTALPVVLQAQPSAHYAPGVEGIKAATLPPPGFYVRDYNYFYWANQINDANGNQVGALSPSVFTYANLPRLLWITDTKFLGGFVGLDGFLPLIYQKANATTPGGPFNGNNFGVGDLFAEVSLSWHTKQFDFSLASGVDMPTGNSPTKPGPTTEPGLGYWTFMQTAGATWYIDEAKTWAVSALNRLEFNTEQRDTEINYGDAYTLEWGVSKSVCKEADLGVVGYYQQQFTGDSNDQPLNRVAAVGPEVSMMFPKQMLFVSLRYNYEFMAYSRAQGNDICLTITKRF